MHIQRRKNRRVCAADANDERAAGALLDGANQVSRKDIWVRCISCGIISFMFLRSFIAIECGPTRVRRKRAPLNRKARERGVYELRSASRHLLLEVQRD